MTRNVKIVLLIIAALLISVVVSFISFIELTGRSDRIFPGVSLKEVNLGELTQNQAAQVLEDYIGSLQDMYINVSFSGGSGRMRVADTGLQVDTDKIVQAAWAVGRTGSYLQQWQERKAVAQNGREIPLEVNFSPDKVRNILNDITREVRVPPKDARLVITPQEIVEIVEGVNGTEIDFEEAFSQLAPIFRDDREPAITVSFVEVNPSETTEEVINLRINGLLAQFTTRFNAENTNRSENVRVAAMALNGRMIKQGEFFSFNDVVGPRSQEAGYKNAKIILNNEFIDGLGGGVCQVSSTLYNVLLRAGINVTERHNHSLVVTYVPMGQDAAVAFGAKDLKFTNNLPCAVIIKASMTRDTVTLKLFGDSSLKKNIRIVNSTIKEYPFKIVYKNDATLPKGQQTVASNGQNGYRVVSKMLVYEGGALVESKQLPSSYYKPLDQVVNVGVKPVQAAPGTGVPSGGGTRPPGDANPPGPAGPPEETTAPGGITPPAENNPPEETSPPEETNPPEDSPEQAEDTFERPVTIPPRP
ncbi:VanW family protein [Phosphitispora fastidiosa]|uniref:VanW family protein n=1 Tax=Phosphitispora fastidiosa TaxID=2837202 RepID=UPI001E5267F1|nr:VanW family protein [Phosphitispora fastidiosa]MBU7007925.1 vancomycin resistance protein YoaR [Phosphitispora fastidiosa]